MALFMCVFEELCSLFNPRGAWRSPPRRFICDYVGGAYKLATLFESYPVQKNRRVNFLGYLLFPLSVCFLIWGFATLINFRLDLPDMEYHVFFYRYFRDIYTILRCIAYPQLVTICIDNLSCRIDRFTIFFSQCFIWFTPFTGIYYKTAHRSGRNGIRLSRIKG